MTEDEIEVTPEMADAGRSTYYQTPRYRGDEPITDEMAAIIYRAMHRLAKAERQRDVEAFIRPHAPRNPNQFNG